MGRALLLHGVGSAPSTMWRVQEWVERAGFDVTAPALPGHDGREAAASYRFDAYAADLEPLGDFDLVIGHSLGGSIATYAAAARPAWTKRLVLIEPAIALDAETLAIARPSEVAELGWTEAELREYQPRWDDRDIAAKLAAAAQALPDAVARTFTENPVWDLEPMAARIAVPTLVVAGDRARNYSIIDETTLYRLTTANPHIEFVTVPHTGHSPHRDDPTATRAIIEGWLRATAS